MMTDSLESRRTVLKTMGALAAWHLLQPGPLFGALEGEWSLPIGVCTSLTQAALLSDHGVAFLEANVGALLKPDQPDTVFADQLKAARACPLPIRSANCFLPGRLKSVGPEADHESVLAFAGVAFQRARQVGIETIVFGSSGSRSVPEGFDQAQAERQFTALLARMAKPARDQGVCVAVEPLNRGEVNFINTVAQGARIVGAVDHPSIGLTADIYHMLRVEEGPEAILRAGSLIRHAHVAEKQGRTPPGTQGDDFKPYLQALKEVGYNGRLSIECRWGEMDKQLPGAVQTLRDQMAGC